MSPCLPDPRQAGEMVGTGRAHRQGPRPALGQEDQQPRLGAGEQRHLAADRADCPCEGSPRRRAVLRHGRPGEAGGGALPGAGGAGADDSMMIAMTAAALGCHQRDGGCGGGEP